jgi:hypothetical protein
MSETSRLPVRTMRQAFQTEMKGAFTAVVERALSRRVIATQTNIDPDMSVELFVLERQGEYLIDA